MKAKPHPEQGFRSCLGILRLARSYGPARLEAACRRGNDIGATSYGSIASILKNGLDQAYAKRTAPDRRRSGTATSVAAATTTEERSDDAPHIPPTNASSRSGSPAWPRRSTISDDSPTSPRSPSRNGSP